MRASSFYPGAADDDRRSPITDSRLTELQMTHVTPPSLAPSWLLPRSAAGVGASEGFSFFSSSSSKKKRKTGRAAQGGGGGGGGINSGSQLGFKDGIIFNSS